MWKNFLTSIGLLTIAMLAALFSSGATRDGRMLAATVSAALALVISIGVGIRFVPRLASSVDWQWLPVFSHYRVTGEGWIYLGSVIVVVFAAINTANNLLYMVLSGLLAVLLLSGFLAALNFKNLRIVIRIPSECYAGEPFPIAIVFHNQKRFFPTFSMSFEPADANGFRFSSFFVPMICGGQNLSQTGQAVLPKRGRYTVSALKASSRYPFGFLLKQRNFPAEAHCLCYPEILTLDQMNLSSIDFLGSNQRFERGWGNDLYMIRDYVPSDSARHVHWKASAKTAILKTREYAVEEGWRINLVFDRFGHPHDAERFEQLVSSAASLAFHLLNEGTEVNFVSDEWQGDSLESILEYLALVEMSSSAELPQTDEASMRFTLRE